MPDHSATKNQKYLEIAKSVFDIEAKAISALADTLDEDFTHAVESIIASKGRLVVSGIGKSGHIGAKISATLASTGTPSFFMHPTEAIHGDLGMLTKDDILLAISYSGESEEIIKILPYVKKRGIQLIGMAGSPDSILAKESNYFLNISVEQEACPLQLAPTSSTTATLAMGDALSVALMEARNFRPEDFATYHPGGSLGRKLLTMVSDIMHKDRLPIVTPSSPFSEVIDTMNRGRLGICVVIENAKVVGVITDGDLRRALIASEKPRFDFCAQEIMTPHPKTVTADMMAIEAENYMLTNKINELLVTQEEKLVGIVQLYDIGR